MHRTNQVVVDKDAADVVIEGEGEYRRRMGEAKTADVNHRWSQRTVRARHAGDCGFGGAADLVDAVEVALSEVCNVLGRASRGDLLTGLRCNQSFRNSRRPLVYAKTLPGLYNGEESIISEKMTIPGKLEITIKINALPDSQTIDNGWKSFTVDCEDRTVSVTVRPKMWKKLEDAHEKFPQWVASIGGQMGAATKQGFVLEKPNIQVFELDVRVIQV